jgi:DNA-binding transcriptional LysR family regulator
MQTECYRVRLLPERVEQLREVARRRSYEEGADLRWPDLVREGIDIVLGREQSEEATK